MTNPFQPKGLGYGLPRNPFGGAAGIGSKSSPTGLWPWANAARHQRRAFTEAEKVDVWIMGGSVPGYDPAWWRYDANNNIISWSKYGDADSAYGWEIDHIQPLAMGGSNDLANLRPLHCRLNRSLGGLLGSAFR